MLEMYFLLNTFIIDITVNVEEITKIMNFFVKVLTNIMKKSLINLDKIE